jgi:hypothetical protein
MTELGQQVAHRLYSETSTVFGNWPRAISVVFISEGNQLSRGATTSRFLCVLFVDVG